MHRIVFLVFGLALGSGIGFLAGDAGSKPGPSPQNASPDEVVGPLTPAPSGNQWQPPKRGPAGDASPVARENLEPGAARIDGDERFGTLLYGMALSRNGSAIESCRITFTDAENPRRRLSASVALGAGYAVTGLRPGKWGVYSKPDGHAALETEVEILDNPTQRLDLVFDPSYLLTVKMVTPDGRPISHAVREAKMGYQIELTALASKQPLGGNLPLSDSRFHSRLGVGRWQEQRRFGGRGQKPAPPEVAGTIEMFEPPPVYVSALFRHVVLASKLVNRGENEVVLEISLDEIRAATSSIRLQVVNAATGLPVVGARVGITDRQTGGGGRPTDANGRIAFENEKVGILELDIWAKNLESYHQLIRITPGEHDLGTIRLHSAHKIAVKVTGANGKPGAGLRVNWQNLDRRRFPQGSRSNRSAVTDIDGNVELSVGPGNQLIQVFDSGKAAGFASFHTDQIGDDPVEIRLQPVHTVRFGPTDDAGRSDISCLTIRNAADVPVWAKFVRGRESIVGLPAGRYAWELHEGTTLIQKGAFSLPTEEGKRFELR